MVISLDAGAGCGVSAGLSGDHSDIGTMASFGVGCSPGYISKCSDGAGGGSITLAARRGLPLRFG